MKHQIVRALQKYLLNPPIKFVFALGLAPPGYVLLETIGRKTGKPRRTPVGNGRIGGQFWIVLSGSATAGGAALLPPNSCVFVGPHDGALGVTAGDGGAETLCLQFPVLARH